jgi:cytochrome c heme-lyase
MGQTASTQTQPSAACPIKHDATPAQCPVPHTSTSAATAPAKCPIDHNAAPPPVDRPAQCPIDHKQAGLDPRNQMPQLSQAPAANQSIALPTAREESTIPRDEASRWEYPSPQQFYNALVRKGWETPEEHVETMVQIHNFLNEQAWQEIVKWEQKENPYVFNYSKCCPYIDSWAVWIDKRIYS